MAKRRPIPKARKVFIALAVAGTIALAYAVGAGYAARSAAAPAQDTSIYRADAPLSGMPAELLSGFIPLRPEQLLTAPIADGFQWPCGTPGAAMIYDAQPFGAMNKKRHGHHTGQDLNGIGGQNTDLDLPVYAAGRGLVVYCGEPSPGWGRVVLLAHRLPDESGIVQTLYAHLNSIDVRVGQLVPRGVRIGSIGTAGGRYLAHLHFEAIPSLCIEAGMPGYHPGGTMNRMNPAELIARYPAPPVPDAYDSIRRLRISEAAKSTPTHAAPAQQQQPGIISVSPSQFL